jgi:hypothetical protein
MSFPSSVPAELIHSYTHMRQGVWNAGSNISSIGMQTIGTYTALMTPKLMVLQDSPGAPVMTADAEMYFMPGVPIRANDQLLDQGDGTRWRVVKVFPWPRKTIVWAARSES